MQKNATSENAILFAIPAMIWGSTWYAITFQLGSVDPLFSIAYRFGLAGLLLVVFCLLRKISLRFDRIQHGRILLQALCLFGFNYWLTYESETLITSGLVALIFSLVIFFNIFFGKLILKNPVRKQVIFGALLGLVGTFLIFQPELVGVEATDDTVKGILLCVAGVVVASLGNIASAFNQRQKLPVISTNALGMLYGAGAMFLIAISSGKTPTFDPSLPYVLSLIYLAIIGSVIAFTAYLTLVGRIGPDKAAYALVIVPMIAIAISILLEGYKLQWISACGIGLLMAGNVFALWRPRKIKPEND